MLKKIFIGLVFLSVSAHASWNDSIINLKTQQVFSLTPFTQSIRSPQVIIFGEEHDSPSEHKNQMRFLNEYAKWTKTSSISVGMEFFDYTKQELVNKYLSSEFYDSDFLKKVGWGKNDFEMYKQQVWFPVSHQGECYALNIPRAISNKIAFTGLDSLTEKEASLLPPDFEIGNDLYKKRFIKYMSLVHPEIPADGLDNFFVAHSSWDDTMAWKISEALENNPYQTIFVIMGRFHVEYGGGLPARLRARGINNFVTVTHYNASQGKLGDLYNQLQPHPEYGLISDYVWIQGEPR